MHGKPTTRIYRRIDGELNAPRIESRSRKQSFSPPPQPQPQPTSSTPIYTQVTTLLYPLFSLPDLNKRNFYATIKSPVFQSFLYHFKGIYHLSGPKMHWKFVFFIFMHIVRKIFRIHKKTNQFFLFCKKSSKSLTRISHKNNKIL